MTPSSKTREGSPQAPRATAKKKSAADLQPPATGASRGSPAAPVMKQFQKTASESSGRS